MKLKGVMLFILLLLPLVSSTIFVEDNFDDLYNVGDLIDVNFSVQRLMDVSGFVESTLSCDGEDFILKKEYVLIEANKKRYFAFESPLSIEGDCRVRAIFLNEEESSSEFKVSDKIQLDYTLNDKYFLPYENITINGTAIKQNGEDYSGLLKVVIEGLDEKSVEVEDGRFYFEYSLPSDAYPKEYLLEMEVDELDSWDNVLNAGRSIEKIEVRPKATSIKINSTEEITPPGEFNFRVSLLDQIDRVFENESIVVKLKNPLGDSIFEGEFLSGENVSYNFTKDSMKGGWNLYAYYGGLVSVKPIYLDSNMEIEKSVLGNVLIFENVGNVPYEGIVKLSLGNETFDKETYINISVPVGENYEYPIYYVGEYNVSLDGENFGFLQLTGQAISKEGYFTWKSLFIFLGVIVFLFLVWFLVFKKKVLRNLGKNKSVEKVVKEISQPTLKKMVVRETPEEETAPISKKTYILFMESTTNVSAFEGIIENYGYKMNKVSETVGYTVFYEKKGVNSELKLYNLAKAIVRFSGVKNEKTSVVINRGQFEGKISLLKKFALLNRSLLKFSKGKILMTKKFYGFLNLNIPKEEKIVEVLDRKLEVYLL